MADTTDTPTTADGDTPSPASRRRGPRKTAATPRAPATRRAPRKTAVEKAENAVTATAGEAAKRVRRTTAKAESAVASAATGTVRRVRRGLASAEGTAASAVKAVKPRSSSRAKPQPARKKSAAGKGGKTGIWGKAAIAGGLAAAGVAAAALFSLKGGVRTGEPAPVEPSGGAHQPDGADSSKSFEARIADESTVPN